MSGPDQPASGPEPVPSGRARPRRSVRIFALLALAFCGGIPEAAQPAPNASFNRVLILASYHSGQPWTDALVAGIRDAVIGASPQAEVSTEYLDTKRFGHRFFEPKANLLKAKYAGIRQDLLFACDDDALQFYMQYGEAIWPGVPVVFAGINELGLVQRVPRDHVTGVTETFSLDPFLEAAMRARGGVRRITVVSDNTTTGLAMRDTMREYSRRQTGLEYEFLDGSKLSLPEILVQLRQVRATELVVASMFTSDRDRKDLYASEAQAAIARASAAPVVSPTTSDLGFGYLCGRANNGRSHGQFAASIGLRVLRGVPTASIPIVQHDIIGLLVDAPVASRWRIPDSAWPADTVFVNRKPETPAAQRILLVLGLVFILAQSAIIAALIVNRARRRKAEDALRNSEESLERAQQLAHVGSWARNLDTGELSWSREVYRIYGRQEGAIRPSLDYVIARVHPDDRERVRNLIARSDARESDRSMEYRLVREDGAERHVSVKAEWQKMSGGHRIVTGTIQDISEIREMEAQVRQVQKMESVGQLAGGIAHDFNNLLTVINGYSQLVIRGMGESNPERRKVEEILRAGEKAAGLTRQLLAFGRRQMMTAVSLDLPAVLESMSQVLRALLGESIQLTIQHHNPAPVKADPAQLEQVILNLVLNARDAMPAGGRISIAVLTLRVTPSPELRNWDIDPGEYTLMTVADTGVGMDEATQTHVFEPFFTTKPTGKGSGLGLATVYGVVKQSGGHVGVWSKPGVGSEFRVYLPVAPREESSSAPSSPVGPTPTSSSETVLLVEDQDSVRGLASETLSALGYKVLEASTGEEGIRLAAAQAEPISLLVTDVVMPGLTGPQLAADLRKSMPGLRVLFITGYAGDALGTEKGHLLLKPFLPSDLAWKVREILLQGAP